MMQASEKLRVQALLPELRHSCGPVHKSEHAEEFALAEMPDLRMLSTQDKALKTREYGDTAVALGIGGLPCRHSLVSIFI